MTTHSKIMTEWQQECRLQGSKVSSRVMYASVRSSPVMWSLPTPNSADMLVGSQLEHADISEICVWVDACMPPRRAVPKI